MIRGGLTGVDAFVRGLERKARAVRADVSKTSREAADMVVSSAEKRSHPRRRVTQQDAPRALSPRRALIRAVKSGEGYRVSMGGQWGHARDPVVQKVMTQEGHGRKLQRRHLWVESRPNVFHKLLFSRNPGLKAWAERADKGRQIMRHAVRLPADVRMRLTLGPAQAENEEAIMKLLKGALIRGLT